MFIFLAIVGVLTAYTGAWFIGKWAFYMRTARRSTGWPNVKGKILSSSLEEAHGEGGTIYSAIIKYEYEVGGEGVTRSTTR